MIGALQAILSAQAIPNSDKSTVRAVILDFNLAIKVGKDNGATAFLRQGREHPAPHIGRA